MVLGGAVSFVLVLRLARRVKALEARVYGPAEARSRLHDDLGEATPQETHDAPAPSDEAEPSPQAAAPTQTGPWEGARPVAATLQPTTSGSRVGTPKAVVFRADRFVALVAWFRENWFLATSALSLCLAGLFLIQYGIENGYVTPVWRVIGAIMLGLALVGVGERIRRNRGDAQGATSGLPSTFSGAGVVVVFAAILAARQIYGLIGPGPTFGGLVAVAAASILMGWLYGPFLSAIGLIGSFVAPFVVGGSSDSPWVYYYYFALIAMAGLAIDTMRRWAWVSVLALVGGLWAGFVAFTEGAGTVHFLAEGVLLVAAATLIPVRRIWPDHSGTMVLEAFRRLRSKDKMPWPEFPTRLSFGAVWGTMALFLLVGLEKSGATDSWAILFAASIVFFAVGIWSRGAPAISDAAIAPMLVLWGVIAWQALDFGQLYAEFRTPAEDFRGPRAALQVTWLVLLSGLFSGLAIWRGMHLGKSGTFWTVLAALCAPVAVVLLDIGWNPSSKDDYLWALHVMAVAGLMALGAGLVARSQADDKRRAAVLTLAALAMITFAFSIVLTKTALTLGLAATVLFAAELDRRFKMRALMYFVAVGIFVITWRLLVDPGLDWALRAGWVDVAVAYATSIGLLAATHKVMASRGRKRTQILTESAAWFLTSLLGQVIIQKTFGVYDAAAHWGAGLSATVWFLGAANQLWRIKIAGPFRKVRIGLCALMLLIGASFLASALLDLSPLLSSHYAVVGPPIFDSLVPAYLLPGLLFTFVGWKFQHISRHLRAAAFAIGLSLSGYWCALEIRRLWHGPDLSKPVIIDGELYSYTVAMLAASVIALFAAYFRRSDVVRRVAVIGIGLTIAKVFLVDTSGLAGLYRVASFLGLGLSLAGLAWVVRLMNARWDAEPGGNGAGRDQNPPI
jgi:uncharacterized membrane protein